MWVILPVIWIFKLCDLVLKLFWTRSNYLQLQMEWNPSCGKQNGITTVSNQITNCRNEKSIYDFKLNHDLIFPNQVTTAVFMVCSGNWASSTHQSDPASDPRAVHVHPHSAWNPDGWHSAVRLHLHPTFLHSQQHLVSWLVTSWENLFCIVDSMADADVSVIQFYSQTYATVNWMNVFCNVYFTCVWCSRL